MRESIAEIVWHVEEAPFMVHLFRDGLDGLHGMARARVGGDLHDRRASHRRPDGPQLVHFQSSVARTEVARMDCWFRTC